MIMLNGIVMESAARGHTARNYVDTLILTLDEAVFTVIA